MVSAIRTDNQLLELSVIGRNPHQWCFPVASVVGEAEKGPLSSYGTSAASRGKIKTITDQFCCYFKLFFMTNCDIVTSLLKQLFDGGVI